MSANLTPFNSDGGFNTAGNITSGNITTSGIANVNSMNISQSIRWDYSNSQIYEDGGLVITGPGGVFATGNVAAQFEFNDTLGNSSGLYSDLGNSVVYSAANVIVRANNSGSAKDWTFDTNAALTLPGGSRLRPLGANLDIFAGTGSYVNLITSDESSSVGVAGSGGYITTAGGTWSFDTTGNLTAPGNISAVGNVTGGNIVTAGSGGDVTLTGGNITGANVISATGSLTVHNASFGGNINGSGNFDLDGDASIGGNLFVTGNINFSGNVTQISGNSGVFYGNASTGAGALYAGKTGYTALPSTIVQMTGDDNAYIQTNLQNTNHGNTASMELAITADDGTDSTNYIDMGIASSTWDGTQDNSLGGAVSARDGYLYVQGGSAGGNLVLGTTTAGYAVKFNAGGPGAANTVATITADGFSTGGNVTGNYIIGDGSQLTGITVSGNTPVSTTGNVSAGNLVTTGTVSANNIGNIAALNLNGNASTVLYGNGVFAAVAGGGTYGNSNVNTLLAAWGSNTVSTTGNITSGYLFGNGSQLTGIVSSYGNSNVTTLLAAFGSNIISTTGTIASGNITSGNVLTGGIVSATGNVAGGNILTAGLVSATGSIIGAVISIPGGAASFSNQGSVNDYWGGTKNVGNITIGGATQTGAITVGQSTATQSVSLASGVTSSGNTKTVSIGQSGASGSNTNITLGPSAGVGTVNIGSGTTMVIANTSGTALSVAGNITGGNVLTGGIVSATGTITGGNLATGGTASATGNITGGNVLTGGLISATGNITTANYFVGNLVGITVSTTGNVSAGNLILGGQTVQLTGAVNPGYMNVGLNNAISGIGAGSVLIYDAVLKNNGTAVTYNTSTGVFTLTAGVTYNLMATGSWSSFSDVTNGFLVYAWVDATTGTRLDTTGDSDGIVEPLNRPVNEFNATAAELIYTPVTNQTVKVSVVANGGTATMRGGIGSKAIVTQINPTVSLGAVATISATGSITADGGLNVSGNIVGTQPNISLVAGSYTYTFDNTGNLSMPVNGDIILPGANSSLSVGGAITSGGYSVPTKVAAFVNAGTFVAMDLIKATVTTSGQRALSLATTTGTLTYNIGATYALSNGAVGGASLQTQTLTTSATTSIFGWNFTNAGDTATYILTDTTNSRAYRITLMVGSSYNNNMITIERLI